MSYGPNGKEIKNKIEEIIKRVFKEEDFSEIETPVFFPEEVYKNTGHLANFKDELFCLKTSDGKKLVGRPEIASTIHSLYKQLLRLNGNKLPIKIFQSGLVLPNDRQTEWQLRTRQYTGHEGHIFYQKEKFIEKEVISNLQNLAIRIMTAIGLDEKMLNFREKTGKEKPFYAKGAYGLYIDLFGKELELLGIQYRSDYDFKKLTKLKLKDLPEVFEISFSTDRPFYAIMANSVHKRADDSILLTLPPQLQIYEMAVFNVDKEQDCEQKVTDIQSILKDKGIRIWASDTGTIGQKFKRADALGIPISLSISQKDLKSKECLLRASDNKTQIAIPVEKLADLAKKLKSNQIFTRIKASDIAATKE